MTINGKITIKLLRELVHAWKRQAKGQRPTFIIVNPFSYRELEKDLFTNHFDLSHEYAHSRKLMIEGVQVISSHHLEENQIEPVINDEAFFGMLKPVAIIRADPSY